MIAPSNLVKRNHTTRQDMVGFRSSRMSQILKKEMKKIKHLQHFLYKKEYTVMSGMMIFTGSWFLSLFRL